ncbi:MAG TPA: phosphotransferase [Kribbella sp.]|nr:phosphotransferase [Kribbella sp.]
MAPVVDYNATSARPGWDELPEAVRAACAVALGTEIANAGPSVGSGFTGGFAAPLRLADGREVFVKAAAEALHAYRAYQREAEVVPLLAPGVRVPAIVATAHATDGEINWFAVASDRIDGRMPGTPWTATDFAAVTANCEAMAEALTPSPLANLNTFAGDLAAAGFPIDLPDRIRSGDTPLPDGFQPWLASRLEELGDLAQRYPEVLAGTSAAHGDLRPDNMLLDAVGRCWTVDWNWLSLGPAWIDWVGLLPLAQHDGIDTRAAIARSPLTADVPADDLDCFAAVVAVYMLNNLDAPPPMGCTIELRRHQRLAAWTFLEWLAVRRDW